MSTSPSAPYKQRQRHYKQLRNRVRRIETTTKNAGKKFWAADGQGYRVHGDGSLRRIDEPAPVGIMARIRGMFRA